MERPRLRRVERDVPGHEAHRARRDVHRQRDSHDAHPSRLRSSTRDGKAVPCEDVSVYSERSACITSTREARAAGISDAPTAAAMSTAAALAIGSAPGTCT